MAEKDEDCGYLAYSDAGGNGAGDNNIGLPARYHSRVTPRGGKRRKTTQVKRQQSLHQLETSFSLGSIDNEPPKKSWSTEKEERYRLDSEDSSLSSVDENYEVDSVASSIEESLTWRGRMQVFLHSSWLHFLIVLLVVADALIVIFELLLDVGAFGNIQCEGENLLHQKEFCHYTDFQKCGPPAKLILERLNISASPGSGIGSDGLCTCKFRGGQRVCDFKDEVPGVNPALVLHNLSLFILSLFVIEIIIKLIAFRLKYFTHKFEVFDGMVVFLSYLLDVASLQEEEAFEAASLLIILRLWRVVRIVNGAVLSAKSRSDQQLSEARLKARKIIHAFHKAQDKMDILEEQNQLLKKELALGKRVRVPRGSSPLQTQEAVDETDYNGTSENLEKVNPVALPEIVVTDDGGNGADGTNM